MKIMTGSAHRRNVATAAAARLHRIVQLPSVATSANSTAMANAAEASARTSHVSPNAAPTNIHILGELRPRATTTTYVAHRNSVAYGPSENTVNERFSNSGWSSAKIAAMNPTRRLNRRDATQNTGRGSSAPIISATTRPAIS